jgi:hypothetical protein
VTDIPFVNSDKRQSTDRQQNEQNNYDFQVSLQRDETDENNNVHNSYEAKENKVHVLFVCVCVWHCSESESDSEQCHTHTHTNKDQITIYAATPPNEPHQCTLTHFNNCNFSKLR